MALPPSRSPAPHDGSHSGAAPHPNAPSPTVVTPSSTLLDPNVHTFVPEIGPSSQIPDWLTYSPSIASSDSASVRSSLPSYAAVVRGVASSSRSSHPDGSSGRRDPKDKGHALSSPEDNGRSSRPPSGFMADACRAPPPSAPAPRLASVVVRPPAQDPPAADEEGWKLEMDHEPYLELESIMRDIIADRAEPRHLPFGFLKYITNGFSDELKIGNGAFGKVYKATLKNGEIVAVKKLRDALPGTLEKQYGNEVHLLRLKHQNIVRILGYCSEERETVVKHEGRDCVAYILQRLICLEYIPNGSLDRHIKYADASTDMNWNRRYNIIKGICCGLHFLHEENQTNTPVVHLDLKPANILLTNVMVPKITDFGLSRFFGEEQTKYTLEKNGTPGYMAKEFIDRGRITKKSDIFSFGVIVLEMITGNRNYPYPSNDITALHQLYVEIEVQKWRERMMEGLSSTVVENNCLEIKNCIELGLKCVDIDEKKRPTIKEITESLNRSLDSSNATTSRVSGDSEIVKRALVPSAGLDSMVPNGLLPNAAARVTRRLDAEHWSIAEEHTAELIARIQPNAASEWGRRAVVDYVRRLIMGCLGCHQVFTFGSVPLKTYLPDDDIDITAFGENKELKDSWAITVLDALGQEKKSVKADFRVTGVQYIQADSEVTS